MPCEHYKDAMIEVAAAGAAPQGELRAHLDECPSCRAAYTDEQSLFATIDSGLHARASAEVPPSLLPRVRARLEDPVVLHPVWMQPLALASVGVALASLVLLMVRPNHPTPVKLDKQTPIVLSPTIPTAGSLKDIPLATLQATAPKHSRAPRNSTLIRAVASSNPEVLVPPNEREGLAQLVATLNQHKEFAAAFLPRPEKKDALVTVDPLQISDIEIKPLEGSETETTGGTGETP